MKNFKPILFSADMVNAILEGRKTMTRRIVKPNQEALEEVIPVPRYLELEEFWGQFRFTWNDGDNAIKKCPYGKIGDVLWVRETCQYTDSSINIQPGYVYKATDPDWDTMEGWKWKPSIFMPKEACRIFLEITGIRIERLQEIGEADAIDEGVNLTNLSGDWEHTPSAEFEKLWVKINGQKSWDENPFVWVITFKEIEKPENFK